MFGMYDTFDPGPEEDRGVTEAEMEAYYADMDARPIDLPTETELEEMFRAAGGPDPFR